MTCGDLSPDDKVEAGPARAPYYASPLFWLLLQMLAIAIVGGLFGAWQVESGGDTRGYIEVSELSFRDSLGGHRTIGYPLVLRAASILSADYRFIPYIHLIALFVAVLLVWHAFQQYGGSPWQALVVGSGVLWGGIHWLIPLVQTDSPAQSLTVAAIAFLLLIVTKPRNLFAWIGVLFCTAFAYQVRPTCLFLIPLLPCLAVPLLKIRSRWAGGFASWRWVAPTLFVGLISPFLAFCLLRLAVVGDFGLVSFSGEQIMGLAIEFLDRPMVEHEISERYRPFAAALLAERERRGAPNGFQGNWRINLGQWERNCTQNIHHIAPPITASFFGRNRVHINQELAAFGREVILLRKWKYTRLFLCSWPRAVAKLLYRSHPLQLLLPATFAVFLVRRQMFRRRGIKAVWNATIEERGALLAVLWIASSLFVANIALVLAVLFVDSRYAIPAGAFAPALVGLVLLREIDLIRQARSMPPAKCASTSPAS